MRLLKSEFLRTTAAACLLGLVTLLVACSADAPPSHRAVEDDEDADAERMERLRSLPYAGSVANSSDDERSGVVWSDPDRVEPGYNLFASRKLCRADLIDNRGNLVHSWSRPGCRFWANVELGADGSLLVVGAGTPDGPERFLMKLSWDNERLWQKPMLVHHDAEVLADGRINVLGLTFRSIPRIDAAAKVRDDTVMTLSPDGDLLSEVSILDALGESFELQLPSAESIASVGHIDSIHSNSVQELTDAALAERSSLYALGNFIICSRQQDSVFILDPRSEKVVWSWGQGTLSGPHDAHVLSNGHVLVFDNGLVAERSRIFEVDPATNEIVWSYDPSGPAQFFTKSRGGGQRLPNGNTLVSVSDEGRAFEIDAQGEIVWDYLVENRDESGERSTFFRMVRYDEAFVDGLLQRLNR